MSEAVFVQEGRTIPYTPSGDVALGEVVVVVDLVGVANRAIAADELGSLMVDGVFDFAKTAGGSTAIPMGTIVYWDNTANVATATSSGNKLLGKAIAAAADADTTVRVRVSQ